MNRHDALANLLDADRAVRSTGATPFLVDGTLLGAVREQNFIVHDRDIDLGVFMEEMNAEMVTQAMTAAGFRLRKTYGRHDCGLELSFVSRAIKVDVFGYYLDAHGRYHAAWQAGEPIRYRYPAFALLPIAFRGHAFAAPEHPERFLEVKYGAAWRVPVTIWDWAWGPHNAEPWTVVA